MIARLEALGDRLLAVVVPRARASAASALACRPEYCGVSCGDQSKLCYRICCWNSDTGRWDCRQCKCPAC
jgi:hypothetical protein